MKRKYETPLIAVEHYELTQAIAACNTKIAFLDRICVLKDSDATDQMKNLAVQNYFYDSTSCIKSAVGMSSEDGMCYHTNASAAFTS